MGPPDRIDPARAKRDALWIQSIDVAAFGALENAALEFGPGATVVLGANEAGKSSLQAALRTLLFGFTPAQLQKHPYRPGHGSGAQIEIAGDIVLAGERKRWVRILDGSGARALVDGDPVRGNHGVAAGPGHGPGGALHASVHCIGPDDLSAYTARPGARLRALLLGDAHGEERVGAARAAVDRERAAIRRASRRGKPALLESIDARIQAVTDALREARAAEDALVEIERRARDERGRAAACAERASRLEARRTALELCAHVAALVAGADVDPGVNPDAAGVRDPGPLMLALDEAEEQVEALEARLADPQITLDPLDALALERSAAVEQTVAEADGMARVQSAAAAGMERASEARARARDVRDELDGADGGAAEADKLASIAAAWAESIEGTTAAPRRPSLAAAAAIGGASAGLGLLAGHPWVGAGCAFAGPVALSLFAARRAQPRAASDTASLERDVRAAAKRAGLAAHHARTPSVALRAAQRLQEALTLERQAERIERSAQEEARRVEEALADGAQLAAELGLDAHGLGPLALARTLEAKERAAQQLADAAAVDRRERERAMDALEKARGRLEDARGAYESVESALRDAVPGEARTERAWERVCADREARAALSSALTALAASQASAWTRAEGTEEFEAALASGTFDGAALTAVEGELQATRAEAERLDGSLARAGERLRVERPQRSVSELLSDRAALQSERRAALDEYDRLSLVSAVLAEGERRHRAQHVPQVLARAGDLLALSTGGRWSAVALDDGDGERLEVRGERGTQAVDAPLSRGAREQAHLCLRIAAAEALDDASGGAALPLLLDEVFAHWDAPRRARGWSLVREVAQERQVVLFTCHAPWAEEAAHALGAPLRTL